MNKSQLFAAINSDVDNDRFRLECSEGRWVTLTLQRNGRTIQHRFEQEEHTEAPAQWMTICCSSEFRNKLKPLSGKVQFVYGDPLRVIGRKGEFTIPLENNQDPLDFDPRDIGAIHQLMLSKTEVEYLKAASEVATLNVEEGVHKKYVHVSIQAGIVSVMGCTPYLTYNQSWSYDTDLAEDPDTSFLLGVDDIELISSFKIKSVYLSVGRDQALAEIDGDTIIAFPLGSGTYNYPKNLPLQERVAVEVEKSTLEEAIAKIIGKAKSLTIQVIDGKLFVKNGKKLAEVDTLGVNTKMKATVKVAASAMMHILRGITMTKLHLLIFPGTSMSIGFELASGAFYLLLGMTRSAIEFSEIELDKPGPQRKVVEERQAIDGTTTTLEAVEVSPLTPDGKAAENIEKLKVEGEKISQKASVRVEQLKQEIDDILRELKETTKIANDTVAIEPKNESLKTAISEAKSEAETPLLDLLNQKQAELKALESGKEKLDNVLRFDGKDLEAFALSLIWTGGRVMELALRKKKTWQLEARVITADAK